MPNGKPGDHPITDITVHKARVYSELADTLIGKIIGLGGEREIENLLLVDYSPYASPDVRRLEQILNEIHGRLTADAKDRGWEPQE